MDHTPNKQSKTDPDALSNAVTASVSRRDDLDPEFEWSNLGSPFESQSSCQGSVYNFSNKATSSEPSSSFSSVSFHLNTPTQTLACGRKHTMTPYGDNLSSYQRPKTMLSYVAPTGDSHHPSVPCPPSQPDSTLDLGYSSNSGGSSYQGQDHSSQRDDLTIDPGSQLDLPMSQGATWLDEDCNENCPNGENELEDLLCRFQKYFEGRLETEVNQFKESIEDRLGTEVNQFRESVQNMILEQQNHVRQIVHQAACIRNENSQSSTDEQEKNLPDSSQPQSSIVTQLMNGSLYIPNEELSNFKLNLNRPPQLSKYDRRTSLLELLADSCSLSSLLTKPEYR